MKSIDAHINAVEANKKKYSRLKPVVDTVLSTIHMKILKESSDGCFEYTEFLNASLAEAYEYLNVELSLSDKEFIKKSVIAKLSNDGYEVNSNSTCGIEYEVIKWSQI